MWMKVDDQLHAHRKLRAVTRSHPVKRRDIAPMGLWVAAGSWSAQNATDGWVPEDELERWDDDWRTLVDRLVRAGWWWASERDRERGFSFNDWHDFNPESGLASRSGAFGNHVRWHSNRGVVDPECEHCPQEPEPPDSGGDIGGRSGGESRRESRSIALPVPDPTRSRPEPAQASSGEPDHTPDRFDDFWNTYGHKVGRKKSEVAYRAALKKPGVTADRLISAAASYVAWCRETGTFLKNPLTWLHGEHWNDERVVAQPRQTNVDQHLALVRQLAEGEHPLPQIGSPR